GCRALRRELIALESGLDRIDRTHDGLSVEPLPFGDGQRKHAPASLRADDDFDRFDVAVGVGLRWPGTCRRSDRERKDRQGTHHFTSRPSVVRNRALACASSAWWLALA